MSEMNFDQEFERGAASVIGPKIREKLALGETVTLQISGDSMRPTLHPRRDALVLENLKQWPPKKGEILFFQRESGGYVLHRVIKVVGEGCIVNGDAQTWTEGPVTQEMSIARASALIRNGRVINADNLLYRMLLRAWGITRPLRFKMFALWRKVKGVE